MVASNPARQAAFAIAGPGRQPISERYLNREAEMLRGILKAGAFLVLLSASGGAYADDPTAVLLQERGDAPIYPGPLPEFTEGGLCYQGMHSEPFPNISGFRCVRDRNLR
ncbi:MAG: hypothetical protein ABSG83_00840 [Roseiarcus sp.]|jgi:hypothetical protein